LSQLRHLGFNMSDKGGGKDITLVQVVVTAIVALVVGLIGFLGGNEVSTKNNQDTITRREQKTSIVNTLLRAVRWP